MSTRLSSISLLKGENSQKIHGKNLPESPRRKLLKNLFLPLISANGLQAANAERIKVTPNPHAFFCLQAPFIYIYIYICMIIQLKKELI
jgi:hypothetical protein